MGLGISLQLRVLVLTYGVIMTPSSVLLQGLNMHKELWVAASARCIGVCVTEGRGEPVWVVLGCLSSGGARR